MSTGPAWQGYQVTQHLQLSPRPLAPERCPTVWPALSLLCPSPGARPEGGQARKGPLHVPTCPLVHRPPAPVCQALTASQARPPGTSESQPGPAYTLLLAPLWKATVGGCGPPGRRPRGPGWLWFGLFRGAMIGAGTEMNRGWPRGPFCKVPLRRRE